MFAFSTPGCLHVLCDLTRISTVLFAPRLSLSIHLVLSPQYLHAFVNDVTILVPVLSDSKHTFAIYTPERTKQRWPIRLAAATELEMHDWVRVEH